MDTVPILADSAEALGALEDVELVYSDLDGTLLGRGGSLLVDGAGQPSATVAEAVVRVNAAGMSVVPVTGRNRIQTAEIARLLGWEGFIAELGCVLVPERGADPIYLLGEWPDDALASGETPYDAIVRSGAPRVLADAFPGLLEPHAPYHLNREATYLVRGYIDVELARRLLTELELPVALVDNGIVRPLASALPADLPEVHAYHLMPPGVTKASAVAEDARRRGLERRRTAAIGDAPTDVLMADTTALCVVLANALEHPGVRTLASGRDNVYATRALRGEGWAEFANAWVGTRR
jgi:hypothetical protein